MAARTLTTISFHSRVAATASALLCIWFAQTTRAAGRLAQAEGSHNFFAATGHAATASGVTDQELLQVPVSKILPGTQAPPAAIKNPEEGDADALQRGMLLFNQMNCSGCHAPNGVGGMGPALSNSKFIYGGSPANIFLTIQQGRPNGMPAWGGALPAQSIWDLVTYVQSISKEPSGPWGKTTSPSSPKIEQVPSEFISTAEPWQHTNPFSKGQRPFAKPTEKETINSGPQKPAQ